MSNITITSVDSVIPIVVRYQLENESKWLKAYVDYVHHRIFFDENFSDSDDIHELESIIFENLLSLDGKTYQIPDHILEKVHEVRNLAKNYEPVEIIIEEEEVENAQ